MSSNLEDAEDDCPEDRPSGPPSGSRPSPESRLPCTVPSLQSPPPRPSAKATDDSGLAYDISHITAKYHDANLMAQADHDRTVSEARIRLSEQVRMAHLFPRPHLLEQFRAMVAWRTDHELKEAEREHDRKKKLIEADFQTELANLVALRTVLTGRAHRLEDEPRPTPAEKYDSPAGTPPPLLVEHTPDSDQHTPAPVPTHQAEKRKPGPDRPDGPSSPADDGGRQPNAKRPRLVTDATPSAALPEADPPADAPAPGSPTDSESEPLFHRLSYTMALPPRNVRSARVSYLPLINMNRTITYEKVHGGGSGEGPEGYMHIIVRFPAHQPDADCYILKCDEHHVHFGLNPIQGAGKHLHSSQHGYQDKTHSLAVETLGYRVLGCTEQLLLEHNALVTKAFGNGYTPLNHNKTRPSAGRSARPAGGPQLVQSDLSPAPAPASAPPAQRTAAASKRALRPRVRARQEYQGIVAPRFGHLFYTRCTTADSKITDYVVMILASHTAQQDASGLPGETLRSLGLWDSAPACCVKNDDGTLSWAAGYEDGGENQAQREFPARWFLPDRHSYSWVKAAWLSPFRDLLDESNGIPEHREAREAYATALGFAQFSDLVSNADRRVELVKQTRPLLSGLAAATPLPPPCPAAAVAAGTTAGAPHGYNFADDDNDSDLSLSDVDESLIRTPDPEECDYAEEETSLALPSADSSKPAAAPASPCETAQPRSPPTPTEAARRPGTATIRSPTSSERSGFRPAAVASEGVSTYPTLAPPPVTSQSADPIAGSLRPATPQIEARADLPQTIKLEDRLRPSRSGFAPSPAVSQLAMPSSPPGLIFEISSLEEGDHVLWRHSAAAPLLRLVARPADGDNAGPIAESVAGSPLHFRFDSSQIEHCGDVVAVEPREAYVPMVTIHGMDVKVGFQDSTDRYAKVQAKSFMRWLARHLDEAKRSRRLSEVVPLKTVSPNLGAREGGRSSFGSISAGGSGAKTQRA